MRPHASAMHKLAIVFTALAAFALVSADASARGVRNLQGTYSSKAIKQRCDAAGGSSIIPSSNFAYGCQTSKGTVLCRKDGKCQGVCKACRTVSTDKGRIGDILGSPTAGVRQASDKKAGPKKGNVPGTGIKPRTGSQLTR